MSRLMTRRSILRLAPRLLVLPALAPSLARSAEAAARTTTSNQATPTLVSLNDVLAAGVERGLPGVALAVERNGKTLFSGGRPRQHRAADPLRATDRFRIYSIAKTFTAIVVLQLVDEDVLTLDDTVTKWLDDPVVAKIPNVERITLRQLLNHSSGIYDYADDRDSTFWADAFLGPNADWSEVWTWREVLAYADAANHAPYFALGEGVYYSNSDYILLGLIVEQATSRRFGDEPRTRVLEPLALNDTFLAEDATMPEGIVAGYQVIEGAFVDVSASKLSWVWTASGMVSTTADLIRFGRAVFSGELLSPSSFKAMFTFVPEPERPGISQGLDVYQIGSPNGVLVGNDGQGVGSGSSMMLLATVDVTVVTLANMAPDEGRVNAVRDEAIAWAVAQAAGTTNASATSTG